MDAIAGIAQARASRGDTTQAAELLAMVAAHPFTTHASREQAKALLDKLQAELPADALAAAAARSRTLDLEVLRANLVKT